MSDVSAISGLRSAQVASRVAYAVAARSQDVAKQQGQAVVSLLEDAAKLAAQLDDAARSASAGGLDVYA